MLKKILLPLLAVAAVSCAPRHPRLTPGAGPFFHSLSIKFSFRDAGARQNGRVLWRFDDQGAKFLFFTPLNQLALELDVAGEEAVLVNFSKNAYWQGDFAGLLERIWGIGVSLAELKSLLLSGSAPPADFAARSITVLMERSGDAGAAETLRLRRGSAELLLRVTRNELRPGRIVLLNYAGRFRAADLDSVLEQ